MTSVLGRACFHDRFGRRRRDAIVYAIFDIALHSLNASENAPRPAHERKRKSYALTGLLKVEMFFI